MQYFYAFMLAWSQIDLAIARTAGSNLNYIKELSRDVFKWESLLVKEKVSKGLTTVTDSLTPLDKPKLL